MGDVVNLRRLRKAKSRATADAQAAENRVAFGRTRAEKDRSAAEQALSRRALDNHRRAEAPASRDDP